MITQIDNFIYQLKIAGFFRRESLTGPQGTGQMLFEKEKIDILIDILKMSAQQVPPPKKAQQLPSGY